MVLLYGDEVVPATVLGLESGRIDSRPSLPRAEAHCAQTARELRERLRRAKVIADFDKRREAMRAGVTAAAAAAGGRALIEDALAR